MTLPPSALLDRDGTMVETLEMLSPASFERIPTHVVIAGSGFHLPGQPVASEMVEARIRESSPGLRLRHGLLQSLTGIETRHFLPEGMQASDLAVAAAKKAMDQAAMTRTDIGLLVWASASQDLTEPATAHIVASKLGLSCPVFDIKNACNSFLNGIQVATALLRGNACQTALVVSGECPSRAIRWAVEDVSTFIDGATGYTMGDAGAALLLTRDPSAEGIFFQKFIAASHHWSLATLPGGGSMHPRGEEWTYFHGNGMRMRNAFIEFGDSLLTGAFEVTGLAIKDFRRVFCHQVSRPFVTDFCTVTGIPESKLVITVPRLGNIASATIPTQIAQAVAAGEIARGDLLMCIGLAAGLSLGAVFLTY